MSVSISLQSPSKRPRRNASSVYDYFKVYTDKTRLTSAKGELNVIFTKYEERIETNQIHQTFLQILLHLKRSNQQLLQ